MLKSRRSTYRKRQRPLSLLAIGIIMAIPLVLILLEVLARLLVGVTGKSAELAAYEGETAIVDVSPLKLYRLKFLSKTKRPYEGLSDRGQLAAQSSLAVGYRLVGKQKSQSWQINEQGFRDQDPVPLVKPKNEIRIFLLGGSTAFGQWNRRNQSTIASKLEIRLNQRVAQQRRSPEKYRPADLPFYKPDLEKALALPPKIRDGQYRVINAAVPGYASGNQLAQLALQILPYNPDAIIVLDGYQDLLLPSDTWATDIPELEDFLSNALGHFWTDLSQQFKYAIADTYLVKATQYWILRPQVSVSRLTLMAMDQTDSLDQYLPANTTELEKRITRYRSMHTAMVRLTKGAGIPLIIAIQPEITGRGSQQISPHEQKILNELGKVYQQRVQKGYAELTKATQQVQKAFPQNVKTLNLYQIYQGFPQPAFLDAIHLTEEGNALISDRLYQTITGLPKVQVPPSRPIP